jgi:hypothetical protein
MSLFHQGSRLDKICSKYVIANMSVLALTEVLLTSQKHFLFSFPTFYFTDCTGILHRWLACHLKILLQGLTRFPDPLDHLFLSGNPCPADHLQRASDSFGLPYTIKRNSLRGPISKTSIFPFSDAYWPLELFFGTADVW